MTYYYGKESCLLPHRPARIASKDLSFGQQCKYAAGFSTAELLPIAAAFDKTGFEYIEVMNRAVFEAAMECAQDDPWDRLRRISYATKNTPVALLMSGLNAVGQWPVADDIIKKFVELTAKNGVDIFGVFDGLNDTRNCATAIDAIKEVGKTVRADVLYSADTIHTVDYMVQIALKYKDMGADRIGVSDISGQMSPPDAYKIIKAIKDEADMPVVFGAGSSGGMADICNWEAVRAGAEVIECCHAALSGGDSFPAMESLTAALADTPASSGLSLDSMSDENDMLKKLGKSHEDTFDPFYGTNIDVLWRRLPGEMLNNVKAQLKAVDQQGRMDDVIKEIEMVNSDFGYPALVLPYSQIIAAQAAANVFTGKRYSILSKESKALVSGQYGKVPGEINAELKTLVLGDKPSVTERPGSLLAPEWDKACADSAAFARTEEDVMSYVLLPATAERFLRKKYCVK